MTDTMTMEHEFEESFLVDDDEDALISQKYMLFKIGTEVYGINICHITEIIELQRITAVPDMPGFMKGVINLRGKVIPIMDVRLKFGMDERPHDDRTCIIIVDTNGMKVGLVVDTVAEVHDIADTDIEPAPQFQSENGQARYIAGLGKVGSEVKILLNVENMLRKDEARRLSASLQAGGHPSSAQS